MTPKKLALPLLTAAIALSGTTAFAPDAAAQSAQTKTVRLTKIFWPKVAAALPKGLSRKYVSSLRASVIGRESRLPLCAVADRDDSPYEPVWVDRTFECFDGDNNRCAWENAFRPAESSYRLIPTNRGRGGRHSDTMLWPDDDAAYGVYGVACRHNDWSTRFDTVVSSTVAGKPANRAEMYNDRFWAVEYAHLHGGFVEHQRPAYARATVRVRRNHAWTARYDNDLVIAIQTLDDSGWSDVATREITTTWSYATYSIQAYVPELTDVRVELRGRSSRHNRQGSSLNVLDARIFVEQCVPDLSNPGQCLE